MTRLASTALWVAPWDCSELLDGQHLIRVEAQTEGGAKCEDQVSVIISQAGHYVAPVRQTGDDTNALGAWPEKGILGTQLGPNKYGRKW
jgi:Icc protein